MLRLAITIWLTPMWVTLGLGFFVEKKKRLSFLGFFYIQALLICRVTQFLDDMFSETFLDLSMARNRLRNPSGRVTIPVVLPTVSH